MGTSEIYQKFEGALLRAQRQSCEQNQGRPNAAKVMCDESIQLKGILRSNVQVIVKIIVK